MTNWLCDVCFHILPSSSFGLRDERRSPSGRELRLPLPDKWRVVRVVHSPLQRARQRRLVRGRVKFAGLAGHAVGVGKLRFRRRGLLSRQVDKTLGNLVGVGCLEKFSLSITAVMPIA